MTKAKKPATGNNTRPLEVIGADLRKLRNIFDSGELLAEANQQCRHGEWLPWLSTYFDADDQTARNHMKAYDLSLKYLTVRDLKVPVSTIYKLTSLKNKKETEAVIEALVKATQDKEEPIRVSEANVVIRYAKLRCDHGDHLHDATLDAIGNLDETDWSKKAITALKKANPDTKETAGVIVNAQHRKHLEKIFGALLPEFDGEGPSLNHLDDVEEEDRQRVLARLQGAPGPFDSNQVWDIVHGQQDEDEDEGEGEGEQGDGEPPETPDSMLPQPGDPDPMSGETLPPAPGPQIQGTDQQKAKAAADAAGDVGGKAELERLTVDVEALQNDKNRLQASLKGRDLQIKDLEAKVKKLEEAESKIGGGIDKLAEALGAALKKVSREKAEEVVEELCKKLGVDLKELCKKLDVDPAKAQAA